MTKVSEIPRVMDLRGTYKGGGGPDKTVLNSAVQHDPEKVYVLVTYLRQPWDREFQISEQACRLGINYVELCDGSLFDLACLQALVLLLRRHRISVLHSHDDKTLLYAWLLRLVLPGLAILHTCHSHAMQNRDQFASPSAYLAFKLRQRLKIFLMRRYLKPVLTVSRDTRARLVADGLAPDQVAVLQNGIDTRLWRRQGCNP